MDISGIKTKDPNEHRFLLANMFMTHGHFFFFFFVLVFVEVLSFSIPNISQGRSQKLKQKPEHFMKVFNVDDVTRTS